MSSSSHILVVGFGNMGRALVRGWLDAGTEPRNVCVVDSSEAALAQARQWQLGVRDDVAGPFDVIIVAVKPQHVDAALIEHAGLLRDDGVIVSIAAGRTIASLQRHVAPQTAVVRSMPNTPAAIGRGTTVICANDAVTENHRTLCSELLSAVGAVFWVDDEVLMDAVTAVSGSGPAYVFLLIECLAAAGQRQGLPLELATDLARHTVAGAGEYAAQSDQDVARLREQVTSPGGTTAAALAVFMENDSLRELVTAAVAAATARSRELSASE